MAHLRQLLDRRSAIAAEMRAINEQNPDALPTEAEARWNTLKGELDGLQSRIDRQALVDDAERRAAGQPLNGGGTGDNRLDAEVRQFSIVRAMAGAAGMAVDWGREREISAVAASSIRLNTGTQPFPASHAPRYCTPTLMLLRSPPSVIGFSG